jgi:hypothetical protein
MPRKPSWKREKQRGAQRHVARHLPRSKNTSRIVLGHDPPAVPRKTIVDTVTQDSLYTRLSQAVVELAGLLEELEAVLPHRPAEGYRPAGASGTPGKPGARMTSWNTAVAYVILEVHAGARELEQNLRYAKSGVLRERGGSDQNTVAALYSIAALAAGAGDRELREAGRTIERWCWKARLALGEAEPWVQIPRVPGKRAARCPFCNFCTLRMKSLSGMVRCCNPACLDQDGYRPVGKVEFGPAFGEPMLVWNSGDIGLQTEDA